MYPVNTRRHKRETVAWPAHIELGSGSIVTGTIRDWSIGGLCFEPEVSYIDGRFIHGAEICAPGYAGAAVARCMTARRSDSRLSRAILIDIC
jgi:hypothetical protein